MFQFDATNRKLTVSVEPTEDYFDLFSNSKFENISGIVGVNGAGKTTVLHFLNVCRFKKPITNSAVLIFKNSLGTYFLTNYMYPGKRKKINVEYIKHNEVQIEIAETANPLEDIDLMFYSNLYSEHNDLYLSESDKLNRSVDYQTRKSLNEKAVGKYLDDYTYRTQVSNVPKLNFNILKIYFQSRFRKLLRFLSAVKVQHPELSSIIQSIPFPRYAHVNFREDIYEQAYELCEQRLDKFGPVKVLILSSRGFLERIRDVNERFRKELTLNIFLQLFCEVFATETPSGSTVRKLEDYIERMSLDANWYNRTEDFLCQESAHWRNPLLKNYYVIVQKLENTIYKFRFELEELLGNYIYKVEVSDALWSFVHDVEKLQEFENQQIINFRWNPLSAGQEAILNQFAELYEGFQSVTAKCLLVCIDEGELYLHPEWQRQYLSLLYEFFSYLNSQRKEPVKMQMLLTSHSPFIASDIPKFSLIFMDRINDPVTGGSKIQVLDSQRHESTFAGNIFNLFRNSFFLKDFFGEFSTRKINEAFSFLHKGESTQFTDTTIQQFIKLVGEKVLRDVMVRQFEIKSGSNQFELVNLTEAARKKQKLVREKNAKKASRIQRRKK